MPEVVNLPQRQNSKPPTDAEPSCLPSIKKWLEAWAGTISNGGNPVNQLARTQIQAAIPILEAQLSPCDPKSFAVAMDKLLAFSQAFGLPAKDLETATDFYLESLSELPPDLLMKAVQKTIAEHKYHVLPKPAEIKSRVEEDLTKRRRHLWLAKRALMQRP